MARQKIINDNQRSPLYTVQATVWKDKKLVGFLHNHLVADTEDHSYCRAMVATEEEEKIDF
jgi:hypothetical protein